VDGLDLATNRGRLVVDALSGPTANAVTRGYHLLTVSGNRARVLGDWTLNAVTPAEATSFDVVSSESIPLDVDNPRA
jgi:NADH:ubiquinone reductase (H+-translocating)